MTSLVLRLAMRLRSYGAHEFLSMPSALFRGVSSPRRSRNIDFEQARNNRSDVAIMTLPIRSFYYQGVSTALLALSLRFSTFCLKFQSVLKTPPSGMGVLDKL